MKTNEIMIVRSIVVSLNNVNKFLLRIWKHRNILGWEQ